jgi:hypothetical protein
MTLAEIPARGILSTAVVLLFVIFRTPIDTGKRARARSHTDPFLSSVFIGVYLCPQNTWPYL